MTVPAREEEYLETEYGAGNVKANYVSDTGRQRTGEQIDHAYESSQVDTVTLTVTEDDLPGDGIVNVTDEPFADSYYFGPADDIHDSAGSNSGRVRSLADAGTAHGRWIGRPVLACTPRNTTNPDLSAQRDSRIRRAIQRRRTHSGARCARPRSTEQARHAD